MKKTYLDQLVHIYQQILRHIKVFKTIFDTPQNIKNLSIKPNSNYFHPQPITNQMITINLIL